MMWQLSQFYRVLHLSDVESINQVVLKLTVKLLPVSQWISRFDGVSDTFTTL